MRRRGGRARDFRRDRRARRLGEQLAIALDDIGERIEIMDRQMDRALASEQPLEIIESGFGVEPRNIVRLMPVVEKYWLDAQVRRRRDHRLERSEEHTSELQSLMRISYAVFCLKKKTIKHTTPQ